MRVKIGRKGTSNERDKQQVMAVLLGLFFFLLLAGLAVLSEGSRGGADNISHYKFSRYAFQYPELLLDHWAKPIYTLIAAPFAQFGYNAVRVLNSLLAVISGYLIFAYYLERNYNTALWGIVVCITAPLYFVLAYSGMMEILFGLMLLLSTLWMLERKYLAAALMLSFLPLVRTESVILIPLYIAIFILLRKSRYLPLLFSGFILYSVIGGIFYKDFLWLITRMPYTGAIDIYGSGDIWHFVRNSPRIFGFPLLVFFITGFILFLMRFFRHIRQREVWIRFLLIWAPVFLFFAAHSYVWWQGRAGSAGLLRVMVCIIPLMSLAAMEGLETMFRSLSKPRIYRWIVSLSLLVLIFWQLQLWYPHPHPADGEMQTVQQACNYIRENNLDEGKIWYYNPYVFYYLQMNPWDYNRLQERVPNPANPSAGLAPGDLIIWDAHFGPNEGNLPLKELQQDTDLQEVKTFLPPYPFTMGGRPYTVELFRRSIPGEDQYLIDSSDGSLLPIRKVMGFEEFQKGDSLAYTTEDAYKGNWAYALNMQRMFSPSIDIYGYKLNREIVYKVKGSLAFRLNELKEGEVVLVISAEDAAGKVYTYHKYNLQSGPDWQQADMEVRMQLKDKTDILKTYVWSTAGAELLIDELTMEVKEND